MPGVLTQGHGEAAGAAHQPDGAPEMADDEPFLVRPSASCEDQATRKARRTIP